MKLWISRIVHYSNLPALPVPLSSERWMVSLTVSYPQCCTLLCMMSLFAGCHFTFALVRFCLFVVWCLFAPCYLVQIQSEKLNQIAHWNAPFLENRLREARSPSDCFREFPPTPTQLYIFTFRLLRGGFVSDWGLWTLGRAGS